MFLAFLLIFFNITVHYCLATAPHENLLTFSPSEVLEWVENFCIVAGTSYENVHMLISLAKVFQNEKTVLVGFIDTDTFLWPNGQGLDVTNGKTVNNSGIILFEQRKTDRSCLLVPDRLHIPRAEWYDEQLSSLDSITSYVNNKCGTFRLPPDGSKSAVGLHRDNILENVFRVKQVTDINMRKVYKSPINPLNSSFIWDHAYYCKQEKCEDPNNHAKYNPQVKITECERLSTPPLKEEFFHKYLKRSRPFIIENITKSWPAFTKWSNQFLKDHFGNKTVHIKMTPSGDYEGVEKAELWENFKTFQIPDKVIAQLKYPDLVVVRPAPVNMKFSEFIDLINQTSQLPVTHRNLSAYLEYTSLTEYFENLEKDLNEPDFVKDILKLKHLNIWLSDGHTLGRLHFDPFDNLLCQLSGKKQVLMFDPHENQQLYEAHIPQAELSYDAKHQTFRRKRLQDSTSMVMSPVDIRNPDLKRFSKFLEAHPVNCTLQEGDVLFLPSFWWHEVQSSPSVTNPRNLAVNYWYEPFLTKEFPCEECPMDINSAYLHLLQ